MFLLYHPESECYVVSYSKEDRDNCLGGEPLLVDVTDDTSHHREAMKQKDLDSKDMEFIKSAFLCHKCDDNKTCPYRWDPYNFGDSCLADK